MEAESDFKVYQTSVDKDAEIPYSSVSSLSGRSGRQRTAYFRPQNRDRKNRDPDKIWTADKIETDRIRTENTDIKETRQKIRT